jgi:MoaA/NifB/PqqE/SkfB family radical SAM enzyme
MKDYSKERSVISFLNHYCRDHGAKRTLQGFRRNLNLGNLFDEYRILKGIDSRIYAFCSPLSVQIDLTNDCNNDCLCCWCNSPLRKNEEGNTNKLSLDYEVVLSVIEELQRTGTREIILSGGGEPFRYSRLFEVIAEIKKRGLISQLYTNFTLINKESISNLVELAVDRLTVSLWAADPKMYCILHPNRQEADFLRIKDNLIDLKIMKQGLKKNKPIVCLHNVINTKNFRQLKEMADFASLVGANEVRFSVVDVIPGVTDELLLSDEQRQFVIKECKGLNNNSRITDLGRFMQMISSDGASKGEYDRGIVNNYPCYTGWLFARIRADGSVNPCLKSHRISLGNIYQKSFKEIWNSPFAQEFRSQAQKPKPGNSYFSIVGNGSDTDIGCFRVCDDLSRNIFMYRKLKFYPTTKVLRVFIGLKSAVVGNSKIIKRWFNLFYLFEVVILYSVMLKLRRLVSNITIFPGE